MPLQLDKLFVSKRQKFDLNLDTATSNWPHNFFWTEGLILLNWTQGFLKRLSELGKDTQEKFWQGTATPEVRAIDSDLFARWTITRIAEYCRIWQSHDLARTRLLVKAAGDYENPKDTFGYALGDIPLDAKKYVIRGAAKFKSLAQGGTAEFIAKLARQNDVRFFIRLGRALQSKKRPSDVDWSRVDPVASFLVNNWCEGQDYHSGLPALCMFSDQALADFCNAAFGKKDGNPSAEAIRQLRKRLGLKQARFPKVKETIRIGNELLLTNGK